MSDKEVGGMRGTFGPAEGPERVIGRATTAVVLALAAAIAVTIPAAADQSGDGPSPIPVTPASVVPLAERTVATIPIAHADAIVGVAGGVWVRTDDGRLVHVDPSTDVIVGEVRVDTTSDPYHYCQALGTDGASIWTCSAAGGEDDGTIAIVQVDPTTHAVVRTVSVDMIFDEFELPFADGRIWALEGGGSFLVGIDIATGTTTTPLPLDARCTQLTATGGSLVAACPADDLLLRIDPSGPSIAVRAEIEDVAHVAGTADDLWVARKRSMSRLDPSSLVILADHGPLPGVADLAIDGESVWIRHGIGFLYRLDRATGASTEQLLPNGDAMSPGSVFAADGSVWVTANDEGMLLRVAQDAG